MIPVVVDAAWVAAHPDAVVADVRWYLDGRSGLAAHTAGHIPGSVWVDLHSVLAAPATPEAGRHPLPTPEAFAAGLRRAGTRDDTPVVAYDDAGGAVAGRLVWLLRLLGHDAAVLDGGIQAWPGELETGVGRPASEGSFSARPWDPAAFATIDDAATQPLVIDSRAPERYGGDTEPVDPRAGHVPGARNAFYADNLAPDGRFKAPADLRARFEELGVTDAAAAVVYCGSGVTACHNLVALEHAGLGRGRLYVGSWSQYSATDRPLATGPHPR